jgi:hypothetical protein
MHHLNNVLLHVGIPTTFVAIASSSYLRPYIFKHLPPQSEAIPCTALIALINGLSLAFLNDTLNAKKQTKERRIKSAAVIILTTLGYAAFNPLKRPKDDLWDINMITLISGMIIGYNTIPKSKRAVQLENAEKDLKASQKKLDDLKMERIDLVQTILSEDLEIKRHEETLKRYICAPGGADIKIRNARSRKAKAEELLKTHDGQKYPEALKEHEKAQKLVKEIRVGRVIKDKVEPPKTKVRKEQPIKKARRFMTPHQLKRSRYANRRVN